MAPPGPPPYTIDQINAMSSKEERVRARAELSSYIARMKKEKQDRLAQDAHPYGGYAPQARHYDGSHSSGPMRGGYKYSGSGSGHQPYHPYQRAYPTYGATKFKNRTVVFNKSDGSAAPHGAQVATPESGYSSNDTSPQSSRQQTEPKTLCPALTSTGVCSRRGCRHLHDPNKQALCKRWLYKDDCSKGDFCQLSHTPSPNNAPTCLHFQEGRCNNENCRFAHIRLNPAAPNCAAFGRLGYCEKGNECAELHAYECPDFANKGECRFGDKCRLGHVHRASRMRQATSRSSSKERASLSDKPVGATADTTDTSELQELSAMMNDETTGNAQQFTEQVDYVPLDAGD